MRFTCKDCKNRRPACHDFCEEYLSIKAKIAQAKLQPEYCDTSRSVRNKAFSNNGIFSDDMWLIYNVKRELGIDLGKHL